MYYKMRLRRSKSAISRNGIPSRPQQTRGLKATLLGRESIKNRLDAALKVFIRQMDKTYHLSTISPVLLRYIREFVLRDGKRLRPILFIAGYAGFARRLARGLYTSALSLELLHDFMLVHDDIVDKSATRRGKPSMHRMLEGYLRKEYGKPKFNGQDLAIVVGDVMYAMAINAFLTIDEKMERKERALKKFIEAAMYTGGGEFVELLLGAKRLDEVRKADIYRIYDFKTAYYSFASPLSTGAILAGAPEREVDRIFDYGICLGRAFQIKDDIIGIFGKEEEIGKPLLTDLQEGKKTILAYFAYTLAGAQGKQIIRRVLTKESVKKKDLLAMQEVIVSSGALAKAEREIALLIRQAEALLESSSIKKESGDFLSSYSNRLLNV